MIHYPVQSLYVSTISYLLSLLPVYHTPVTKFLFLTSFTVPIIKQLNIKEHGRAWLNKLILNSEFQNYNGHEMHDGIPSLVEIISNSTVNSLSFLHTDSTFCKMLDFPHNVIKTIKQGIFHFLSNHLHLFSCFSTGIPCLLLKPSLFMWAHHIAPLQISAVSFLQQRYFLFMTRPTNMRLYTS